LGTWSKEAEEIMAERFGKDTVIALATTEAGKPRVRYVDAYYEAGSFYIVVYSLSNKMRQLATDPSAAIAGDWFTAQGRGIDLGPFAREENRPLAKKLEQVFSSWLSNGHTDPSLDTTHILQVELEEALLLSHGRRFEYKKSGS